MTTETDPAGHGFRIPLAMQIVALLLGGLVVAQLVTLCMTMLAPPAPPAQYGLNDIATVLKGGSVEVKNARPLVRTVRAEPPSLQSAGWLVSESSRADLARLLGADEADVRLLFYSPLPFAGATGIAQAGPARTAPRVVAAAFGPPGLIKVDMQMAPGGGPAGPGGWSGGPGGGPGRGFPGGQGLQSSGDGGFSGGFLGAGGAYRSSSAGFQSDGARSRAYPNGAPAQRSYPGTSGGPSQSRSDTTTSPGTSAGGSTIRMSPRGDRSSSTTWGPSGPFGPLQGGSAAQTGRTGSYTNVYGHNGFGSDGAPSGGSVVQGLANHAGAGQAAQGATQASAAQASAANARTVQTGVPAGVYADRLIRADDVLTGAGRPGDAAPRPARPVEAPPTRVHGRLGDTTALPSTTAASPREQIAAAAPVEALARVATPKLSVQPAAPAAQVHDTAGWPIAAPTQQGRGLFGLAPAPFVQGDFVAAVRVAPGRWITAQPQPEPFPNSWQRRVLLWFLVSFSIVGPIGYLFARRLAAPLEAFAGAAERLGRNPSGAVIALKGPAEIGRAASAFNQMGARLKRFIEDRTAMVGAISHDLRTPLARMRFRMERAPPELRDGMLNDIGQMEEMISSVLVFIRDASEPSVRERVDLRSILECVVDDAALVGGDAVLDPGDPISVDVDTLGVQRVLANLIDNALKYGDRAHVRMFAEGDEVVAEIADAGPGLPEEELERVFLPFYRSGSARTLNKGGIGLGLAVSRSIARAHGGDVRLAREGERGLRAQLRLPLASKAA